MMEYSFTINSVIQGCHVYKHGCDAIGEVFFCEQERGNRIDPCVVAVNGTDYTASGVLGNVPHFIR